MEPLNTQDVISRLAEPFASNELEWRSVQVFPPKNQGGPKAIVVPYVQSRAIMNRLDQVVGWDRWENEVKELPGGGITQGIRIWITQERSIVKYDGADRTQVEPTKGGLSSALKRAAGLFQVGRYLYSLGEFWVEITQNKKTPKDVRVSDKKQNIYGWFTPPTLPKEALPQGEQRHQPQSQQQRQQTNQQGQQQPSQQPQDSQSQVPPGLTECVVEGIMQKQMNGDVYYEIALLANGESVVVFAIGEMARQIEGQNINDQDRIAVKASLAENNAAYVLDRFQKLG